MSKTTTVNCPNCRITLKKSSLTTHLTSFRCKRRQLCYKILTSDLVPDSFYFSALRVIPSLEHFALDYPNLYALTKYIPIRVTNTSVQDFLERDNFFTCPTLYVPEYLFNIIERASYDKGDTRHLPTIDHPDWDAHVCEAYLVLIEKEPERLPETSTLFKLGGPDALYAYMEKTINSQLQGQSPLKELNEIKN